MRIEGEVETWTTQPDADGQFLYTAYRGNGPVVRTVAWRQSPADTWGVERVLFAEGVPDHSCEDTSYKYGVPCPCPKAEATR